MVILFIALIIGGVWYFKPEKATFKNLKVYDKFKDCSFTSISLKDEVEKLNSSVTKEVFDFLDGYTFTEMSNKESNGSSITKSFTFLKDNSSTNLRICLLNNNGILIIFTEEHKDPITKSYTLDKPLDIKALEKILGI